MQADESRILRAVLTELAKEGVRMVPVGISARHVHLCQSDLQILFGQGAVLHPFRDLSQPGQFASQERITLQGPGGSIENVRVLGPVRSRTQVEVSLTDAVALGIKDLPVRMSGDLDNTPGIRIIGPAGSVDIPAGTIAAARHIHMNEQQARAFRVHDGQVVSVRVGGKRPAVLENVVLRTGKGHELELHVDTDEANACGLKNSDILELLESASSDIPKYSDHFKEAAQKADMEKIALRAADAVMGISPQDIPAAYEVLELVTEEDINCAAGKNITCVYCSRKALITPAAKDRSAQLGIDIIRADERKQESPFIPSKNEEILELVTAQDLNAAFRDDKKEIFCTQNALITPAAKERIEETNIRIVRIQGGK